MNFHLTPDGINVERRPRIGTCCYCKKVFTDSQALGGHLRSHREGTRSRKSRSVPRRSGNSLNMTGPTPNPHMTTQSKHFSGDFGNNQGAGFSMAPPSVTFPQRFPPSNNGLVNAGQFSENRVGNTRTPVYVSPNFSSGGVHAENRHFNPFSYAAPAPTYSTNPSVIPSNHSFLLRPGNAIHFTTYQSQSFMDGGQFSENALPNIQYPNQGTYAGVVPNSLLELNQVPAFREPTNIDPLFPSHSHPSGQGVYGQYNKHRILTHEGGKRCCFGEAPHMMSAPKRPKIDRNLTMETEEHEKKELLLFKDVEKSFLDLGTSIDGNEEPKTDLDLSLHL